MCSTIAKLSQNALYIVAVIPIYVLLTSVSGDSMYTVKDKEPDTKAARTHQGEEGMEIRT